MTDTFNIAAHVGHRAREQPDRDAILEPARRGYRRWTFEELERASNRVASGLREVGIRGGTRTVLMARPSLDFFALTFGLFKAGAVPVLVDPGLGVRHLGPCLEEAEPEAFIGIPRAHVARLALGWARKTVRWNITVGRRLGWSGTTLASVTARGREDFELEETPRDRIAAILFTSGSTGPPKGAVYTHGNFAAQVEILRALYGIEPGEIDLPTFPLFGLFDPALGMTAVLPEMDFTRPGRVDPAAIFGPIREHGITNLFGSPALIDRVSRAGGPRLDTLRRVLSAGAPVPASTVARFQAMLPDDVQIFTPYGATEALPVASIGSHTILSETGTATSEGRGVCVGDPVPGARVDVFSITDDPIETWSDDLRVPPGEIGEIVVRGPMVTREYYGRPAATRLAKIAGPAGETAHRMGDLGYLDGRGRLWFCGRKSQRVRLPERTLFTEPCEGVFDQHPAVFRSALVGVQRNGTTEPVLWVELERSAEASRERVREELLALARDHETTSSIRRVLFRKRFPVDIRHNAKISRERLAAEAARRLRS